MDQAKREFTIKNGSDEVLWDADIRNDEDKAWADMGQIVKSRF